MGNEVLPIKVAVAVGKKPIKLRWTRSHANHLFIVVVVSVIIQYSWCIIVAFTVVVVISSAGTAEVVVESVVLVEAEAMSVMANGRAGTRTV